MTDQLMSRSEIVRRLRFVTSGRVRHRPLTMMSIAARTGLSRMTIYRALHGDVPDGIREVLSQILVEVDVQRMIEDTTPGLGPARRPPG